MEHCPKYICVHDVCEAIGIMFVLTLLGFDITPLFAVVGGASFIIAFAMQETLGNLASGLLIMFTRPFDVGDFVEAAGKPPGADVARNGRAEQRRR